MDAKGKEKGILKLDSRSRVVTDTRLELTPQASYELAPSSPLPSVDRLSVTWADPEPTSMNSSAVNLCHLPSESNEVRFSPTTGEGSEDEDYSASLSAVLRQRRASVRRSRKGRGRRPSSPFLPDDTRPRRRSSVFTTSSGDTAISMEEGQPAVVTQEQIFENIHLHKEVLGSVKQQPLGMRRKLKLVHQAKAYIKRHEGQLQERLAQSKSTRDIYARFNILLATKWQQLKREAANTSNLLIPWELRIKEIESHFGSVVASYFTFLRWLFWVNLVIAFILLVFVIVPEYLTANPSQDGERKIIMEDERRNASNLLTLWEFEGILKFSPIFYGYYTNLERPEYRMPLAYFLTGLVVYIYSFVAILRKMAENSRMSKLSEKEDECIFSWKLFTGWDFMIGNTETAHNRIASVILGFKEALLEEAEKKKDVRNWRIISLRALVNVCVVILLAVSAYAVVKVVSRSDNSDKSRSWWRENETTIVVTVISITFPVFFELLGFLEHYHPRKQLRLQLARIMLLNLLNLYSLIFALFSKIEGMSKDLDALKPTLTMNASTLSNASLTFNESILLDVPTICFEVSISCAPCNLPLTISDNYNTMWSTTTQSVPLISKQQLKTYFKKSQPNMKLNTFRIGTTGSPRFLFPENLIEKYSEVEATTENNAIIVTEHSSEMTDSSVDLVTNFMDPSTVDDNKHKTSEQEDINYPDTTIDDALSINQKQLAILKATYFTDIEDETSSEEEDDTYNFDDISALDNTTTTEVITQKSVYTNEDSSYTSDTSTHEKDTTSQTPYYTESLDYETNYETTETDDFPTITEVESSFSTISTFLNFSTENITEIDISTIKDVFIPFTNTESSTTTQSLETASETETDIESTVSTFNSTDSTYTYNVTGLSNILTTICPNISFNCTVMCSNKNVTQVFVITNCTMVSKKCYTTKCKVDRSQKNKTTFDVVYEDDKKRRMYNLTKATKKRLLKLCWETMFGQELVKLTMMDLVFVLLGTLFMDFFRALFVRYMNRCWCWDLEKKFPEYGDFKIAENILHLINNQGMVWMGMFFSPGLVVLNVSKLMIMMYLRSWAVMTCNVPHEVVFRVSKSNNFYLALLLTMLFLCVLPVGYTIVWVKPSWHCGPFSEYDKIYYILTSNIYKILPTSLNFALEYIASPAIVIPLLVLLILIIYYLTSLTNSLREANNDLKIQLRRERTEERRKMFQLADTRRRVGSSALDNTPFARWKKALPALPHSKSIDSDDRKTGDDTVEPIKTNKRRSGIFAKIVGLALDKKPEEPLADEVPTSPNNVDEETDTDFHETLPKEVLKFKAITITKLADKKKNNVDFKPDAEGNKQNNLKVKPAREETEKRPEEFIDHPESISNIPDKTNESSSTTERQLHRKQTTESNTSKQSDSFGSVIPVITISTTESDEEVLQSKKGKEKDKEIGKEKVDLKKKIRSSDLKSLQRQSSVDSVSEPKAPQKKKNEDGHKYQYSL